MKLRDSFFILLSIIATTTAAQPGFGDARPANDAWLFSLGDDSAAISPAFDDSRWQRVNIPHDWSARLPMSPDCGSCQGYLPGGIAWYRRHLSAAELPTDGKRLFVYFEGVYNRSSVYLNGQLLGYRPSGFASFLYDLTPYLRTDGDNVLSVRVDHSRQNDSRWYTGSGIYRPVWFVTAPATHFALWGTSWKIKSLNKKKAVVEVSVEVENADPQAKPTIVIDILDAAGKIVATAGSGRPLTLSSPRLWSLSDPYLYKVRARLMMNGREADRSEVPLGLRTLDFSPDRGFALNGTWTKVKGVCLHDDAGVLGTAVPPSVWRQRLLALKQLGVNAIRMSHNPHAPSLYALCDTLGLLVMDEASDEWEFPKRKWLKGWNQGTPGYEGTFDYFEEWIDRDVADMVRRDRCHPSIFLWSIGNEVDYPNDPYSHPVLNGGGADFTQPAYGGYKPNQPNAERIGLIAQRLSKIVRDIDDSRAVTGALAGVVMSNETAYPEAVDVVGYNYTESRYLTDHQRYPRRVIYGSENRHDLAAWKAVHDNEHIFGQFLWTGIDYLGESGPWPARGSEAGLIDLAGHVKPMGHYRAALWSEQPVCYIGTYPNGRNRRNYRGREFREWVSPYAPPLWNYDNEGMPVRVVCYTNAPTARLFLNDQPIGGEPKRDEATGILYWDIAYAPGTLRCEAIASSTTAVTAAPTAAATAAPGPVPSGTVPSPASTTASPAAMPVPSGTVPSLATATLVTSGRPYALHAHAEQTALTSPTDVARLEIEVTDEEGRLVTLADNEITCQVLGPARLLGLENGNIRDTSDKTDNRCRAHAGRLVAYIAAAPTARDTERPIRIRFTSPLLKAAEVSLP